MIGLFGGTFDPVHFGHLRPVLEVSESLNLSRVYWIPSHQPPHRRSPRASIDHRMAMLDLAINCDAFDIDKREVDRHGPSYTIDTVISVRKDHPDQPIILIMGLDAFTQLDSWHRWNELLQYVHIVVCDRPQSTQGISPDLSNLIEQVKVTDPKRLKNQVHGFIYFQDVTSLAISATQIRDLCAQNKSIHYLLPEAVERYIHQHDLYQ